MFCPGCATPVTEDMKFCKACGAHLRGIREAMTGRGAQFDWSKTWVAEVLMSEEERERRKGITPEHKRINEIKAGVITTLVGLGSMIFLYFLLGAVAANEPRDSEIIRRVWLAGLVPFLIGLGLIFNGVVLSKRLINLQQPPMPPQIPGVPTNQLPEASRSDYSIIENTTAHLPEKPAAVYASEEQKS